MPTHHANLRRVLYFPAQLIDYQYLLGNLLSTSFQVKLGMLT
jgi:hypothetical protein